MTLARLRQNRGPQEKLTPFLDKKGISFGKYKAHQEDVLKELANDKLILMPHLSNYYGTALRDVLNLEERLDQDQLIILQMNPIFTGGYAENKPSKEPYYHLFNRPEPDNTNARKTFYDLSSLAQKSVRFPTRRVGYSWSPDITAELADKRKGLILESSLALATILKKDPSYYNRIRINDYSFDKTIEDNYKSGMNAIARIPSKKSESNFDVRINAMPAFKKSEVGFRLTDEQAAQTLNFRLNDKCRFGTPFEMNYSRRPATKDAMPDIKEYMVVDHHGPLAIGKYTDWLRENKPWLQVPSLFPEEDKSMISMFWKFYENTLVLERDGSHVSVSPLDMWMINRLLINYRGLQNDREKNRV